MLAIFLFFLMEVESNVIVFLFLFCFVSVLAVREWRKGGEVMLKCGYLMVVERWQRETGRGGVC